ncbi:MAG: AAA family ATPase [Magnetococcales bacterium]|nr:AAA family ATPase [Magnetococcales bacterium]
MLKRLYIDNFRCLVNFDVELRRLGLFLGENGSGKSSLFDALDKIRRYIVEQRDVGEVFLARDFPFWMREHPEPRQSFELTVEGNGGIYRYRLVIDLDLEGNRCRVWEERLTFNEENLFVFEIKVEEVDGRKQARGLAQLFRDDAVQREGPVFPTDWSRSGIGWLMPHRENRRLQWFKNWLREGLCLVRFNPSLLGQECVELAEMLQADLSNYAAWYNRIVLQEPEIQDEIVATLKNIMEGYFSSLSFSKSGSLYRLQARVFGVGKKVSNLEFNQLSDGQKALIVLYSILVAYSNRKCTVLFDEPENYLALPEVQHWFQMVLEYYDQEEESSSQYLMLSHHPRIMDGFAMDDITWLYCQNGMTRKRNMLDGDREKELPLSILVEQGWITEG